MRPNKNTQLKITPIDFEKYVKSMFDKFEHSIVDYTVLHNVKEKTYDGEYQIDIKITFELLNGAEFIVLVECKRHKDPIKREVVAILKDKLKSVGAHKGIIVSTSEFQKGALEYSKVHGIALANIIDGELSYTVKSQNLKGVPPPQWLNIPEYIFIWISNIEENSYEMTDLHSEYIKDFERILVVD